LRSPDFMRFRTRPGQLARFRPAARPKNAKLYRLFVLLMIGFVACAPPPKALAQYIGNVGLQTTQQTLATTVNCTGSAQVFPISNLGQTQHYLSATTQTQPTMFQAEIDGIDKQGNVYRISDVMQNAFTPIIAQSQGTVTASGYFPKIQAKVTCSPNTATFTLSYSGSQVTFNQNAGSYINAQIDHVSFAGTAGNANQFDTYPTPFGSSAGTIYFAYSGPVAGSTLMVECNTNQFSLPNGSAALSVTLANTVTLQTFQVPDQSCPFVTVKYTSGGAATSIIADYVYTPPGRSVQATQYTHITGTTATVIKPSAGFLHTLNINLGNAAGTLSVFDLASASCTGTPATNTVAVITTTAAASLPTFTYDVNMLNGICVKASAAMDVTVSAQ